VEEEAQREGERAAQERDALQAKVAVLEDARARSESESEKRKVVAKELQETNVKMQLTVSALEACLSEANTTIDDLRAQLVETVEGVSAAAMEHENLVCKLQGKCSRLEAEAAEAAQVQNEERIKRLQGDLSAVEEEKELLVNAHEGTRKKLEEVVSRLKASKKLKDKVQIEVASLQSQLEDSAQRVSALESELGERVSVEAQLRRELEDVCASGGSKEAALVEAMRGVEEEAQREGERAAQERDALQAKVAVLENEVMKSSQSLFDVSIKLQEVEEFVAAKQTLLDDLGKEKSAWEEERSAWQSAGAQWTERQQSWGAKAQEWALHQRNLQGLLEHANERSASYEAAVRALAAGLLQVTANSADKSGDTMAAALSHEEATVLASVASYRLGDVGAGDSSNDKSPEKVTSVVLRVLKAHRLALDEEQVRSGCVSLFFPNAYMSVLLMS
jgi:chromosome segregation ATPase